MSDDEKDSSGLIKVENKVNLPGEKTDEAIASLLKQALDDPAIEASGVLGDLVGLFGDRLKVFRAEKRITCMLAAKKRLEERGVTPEQAQKISEGRFYDLIEGMGKADTEELQNLWAGLMAGAMDPNNAQTIEKSYINIIENLSAEDARILEFVAAVKRLELWEREAEWKFDLRQSNKPGVSDPEEIKRLRKEYDERRKLLRQHKAPKAAALRSLMDELGIVELQQSNSALLNLHRLGLVKPRPEFDSGFDYLSTRDRSLEHIADAFNELNKKLKRTSERTSHLDERNHMVVRISPGDTDAFERPGSSSTLIVFTKFGEQFAEACDLLSPREPI